MNTQLLYLENMHALEADAVVERIDMQADRTVVYLDQTILYPQGGGQPYDTGIIKGEDANFIAQEVRFVDGEVLHIGHFEGQPFMQGEPVHMVVDGGRRKLNARLHSAGHLVDMAVNELGLAWIPDKGYHFPDSPYVGYEGQLELEERDDLIVRLQDLCDQYIAQDLSVHCRFVDRDELVSLCRHIPGNLPINKPIRVVQFDNFAVPCGGTHVYSLAELEEVTITKLKGGSGAVRVGYNVSR